MIFFPQKYQGPYLSLPSTLQFANTTVPEFALLQTERLSYRNPIRSGPNQLSTDNLPRQQSDPAAEHPCYFSPFLWNPKHHRDLRINAGFSGFLNTGIPISVADVTGSNGGGTGAGVNQNKPTPEILVGGISPGSAGTYDWLSLRKHRGNQWGRISFVKGLHGILPS